MPAIPQVCCGGPRTRVLLSDGILRGPRGRGKLQDGAGGGIGGPRRVRRGGLHGRLLASPVMTSTMSSVAVDGLVSADPRVQELLETNTCGSAPQGSDIR